MDGIQYINSPEGEQNYAVVDLNRWGALFNHFLEEVEDTIAYDSVVGKDIDRDKLLSVLKEKLVNNDLTFNLPKTEQNAYLNGNGQLHLQDN